MARNATTQLKKETAALKKEAVRVLRNGASVGASHVKLKLRGEYTQVLQLGATIVDDIVAVLRTLPPQTQAAA